MANFTQNDLAVLGTPDIIETLDFETVLARRTALFVDLMVAAGYDYDASNLELDPAVVLLQEGSYEEVLLRARGNDIARQRYLYWAMGEAIDHLAAFYDVVRLADETDARFVDRIITEIQGRSTGGTAPRYRAVAMGSSIRVADAKVYRIGKDPTVYVAVFAADNNGVADTSLLATVRAAVTADAVRMVNDTIVVRSAVVQVVNVTASVWLQPNSEDLLASLEAALPGEWEAQSGLGRDLTLDWIKARLMVAGVYRVTPTAPSADVIADPYSAVRIGTVTLNLMGRDF